jgi:hypothetical protein
MGLPGVVCGSAAGFRSGEPWREPHEHDRQLLGEHERLHEPERHPAERRLCLDAPLPAASNVSRSDAASVTSTSARPPAHPPDRVAGGLAAPRISFCRALPRHLLRGCTHRFRPSRPDAVNAAARADPPRALTTAAYARLHASELSLAATGQRSTFLRLPSSVSGQNCSRVSHQASRSAPEAASRQARGRNPARVTVTRRRTAALDGRLLAAVSAWRQ